MKKNLTKNIPLKIMSIIVGILVWLIVVNVDDPIITKGFVISDVQIINEAYVDQLGEMVMQDDVKIPYVFILQVIGRQSTVSPQVILRQLRICSRPSLPIQIL